jgi:hypothetical protein
MTRSFLAMLVAVVLFSVAHAAEEPKAAAKPDSDLVKWQDSEAGQFVYFAVLEGLFRDGVPNDVVDLVINPARDLDNKVKHVFVLECDICHAAYEAFVFYRKRQVFQKSGGRDTFGNGVKEQIVTGLKHEDARTRVYALGAMMRPWILARVEQQKLSREKQEELVTVLLNFKSEANKKLDVLRKSDPLYKDWGVWYGGCQACEAATDIERNSRK